MTIFSAALLLFLVMDPFGNIPLFLAALKNVDPSRHRRIIARELLVALAVLVASLFAGQGLLRALRISEPALTTAGGAVLFLIAIRMVFPGQGGSTSEEVSGEPFIVPLAVPYVAGPSALASVLLIMSREPRRWPEWLAAVLIAWLASGLIIAAAGLLARHLGEKVLLAMERLMGMLLVAMATQMFMTGIYDFMVAH
jgi:small neutral amino acid transporter SnatA (MarC family)